MKALGIASWMMAFLMVINIFFHIYIFRSAEHICGMVDEILMSGREEVPLMAELLSEEVGKCIPVWQLCVDHGEVDDVAVATENVIRCTESGNMYLLPVYLGQLGYYVENIMQREKLCFCNIF